MPCGACGSPGVKLMGCTLTQLGVVATKWNELAHAAMYRYLSVNASILSERGQDGETIKAIPFGAEPEATANYFVRYVTQFAPESSGIWGCMGLTRASALEQVRAASGTFYRDLLAAATNVVESEKRSPSRKTGEGIPTWMIVTGVLLGTGLVVAVVKD